MNWGSEGARNWGDHLPRQRERAQRHRVRAGVFTLGAGVVTAAFWLVVIWGLLTWGV